MNKILSSILLFSFCIAGVNAESLKLGEIKEVTYVENEINKNNEMALITKNINTDIKSIKTIVFKDEKGVLISFSYGFGKVFDIEKNESVYGAKKEVSKIYNEWIDKLKEEGWSKYKNPEDFVILKDFKDNLIKEDDLYSVSSDRNKIRSLNTKVSLQIEKTNMDNTIYTDKIKDVFSNSMQ